MPRGRPRTFDLDRALDAALLLFWRHGYEGTSLAALTKAMDINVPSLYAAFGNKESLFRKALDRYIQKPASYLRKALEQPTARRVAEKAFRGAIDMVMHPGHPNGCLLVHGALATNPEANSIRKELNFCAGRQLKQLSAGDSNGHLRTVIYRIPLMLPNSPVT